VSKIKLDELIKKAKEVFKVAKKKTILTGEGLTRTELRLLERRGFVKKMPIYKEKKYKDNPSTMTHIWELIGEQ